MMEVDNGDSEFLEAELPQNLQARVNSSFGSALNEKYYCTEDIKNEFTKNQSKTKLDYEAFISDEHIANVTDSKTTEKEESDNESGNKTPLYTDQEGITIEDKDDTGRGCGNELSTNNIEDPSSIVESILDSDNKTKRKSEKPKGKFNRAFSFSCDNCGVKFVSADLLGMHIKNCKSRKPSFVKTENEQSSKKRKKRKKQFEKNTYFCDHCSYETERAFHLKSHLLTHTGEKPHACDICGKSFARADGLTIHKKRVHCKKLCEAPTVPLASILGASDYTGSIYRDGTLKLLNTTTVSGGAVFACPRCPYKTVRSWDLTTHLRTHTGERPFACKHCDYKTAYRHALRGHMRRHEGDRPHACPYCPYRSLTSGDLRKHLGNKHAKEISMPLISINFEESATVPEESEKCCNPLNSNGT